MGINVIRDGYCYGCFCFEMELINDYSDDSQDVVCIHEQACMRIKYLMETNPPLKEYEKFNCGLVQNYYKYCIDKYQEEVETYGTQLYKEKINEDNRKSEQT